MEKGGTRRPLRHDLKRRRTLKSRSALLKQYGTYACFGSFFLLIGYAINKKLLNPPEYESKE